MELAKARRRLREIYKADNASAPMHDEDGEPSWGPVVVCASISRADFCEWLETHEGDLRRWVYEPLTADTGRVIVYSLPSAVHGAAVMKLKKGVERQLAFLGGYGADETITALGNLDVELEDRVMVPDLAIMPHGLQRTNLVVEIAYKNDSQPQLQAKLLRWMGPDTDAQVAIGIKIFVESPRRLAILHIRNGPSQRVWFGADVQPPPPLQLPQLPALLPVPQPLPVPQQPLPPLSLHFPLRLLFAGTVIPHILQVHANHNIVIDLVAINTVIEHYIAMDAEA